MIPQEKLDNWIENNFNVMLIGEAGVGKTALVLESFKRHNLRFKYFSCAVLDPWLNFIGCPKEVEDVVNGEVIKYLDLVRPKDFAFDAVDAIFLDEYNRANKNIKNAVMELIQFKSVHGKRFENLRFVWTAINPPKKDIDGEYEYDVEKLDKAQMGRFHIKYHVPYKCDKTFFINKYGDMGSYAVDWWNELEEDKRKEVSPRDLDYALMVHNGGGDIRDSLPSDKVNVGKLIQNLSSGSITSMVDAIFRKGDLKEAKKFINKENYFEGARKKIVLDKDLSEFFFPLITNKEKIIALSEEDDYYKRFVTIKELKTIFTSYIKDNPSTKLSARLKNDGIGSEPIFSSVKFNDYYKTNVTDKSNGLYLDDKQIDLLRDSLSSDYDKNTNIWDSSSGYKTILKQWLSDTNGRKKIYSHLVHYRSEKSDNFNVTLNILGTLIIIICHSHFKTLKNNSFREFFHTILTDLKSHESKISKEEYNKQLDFLKTTKLDKIEKFIDYIMVGNGVSTEDSDL